MISLWLFTLILSLSNAKCANNGKDNPTQSDVGAQSIGIDVVANYATVYSTGQGIVDFISGDYGGTIRIKNYLCGGNLIYKTSHYLEKGYFKAHCSTVLGGQDAGCTLSGYINRGAYGMVQYQLKTADSGLDTVQTLNIFFQMSQGWGAGSQAKNRVDVFWSDTICDFNEQTKRDPQCYRDLTRRRDDLQCWKQNWIGSWYYDEVCSEK
eukprot:UN06512